MNLARRAPALRFFLAALGSILLLAGCGERACFQWSNIEGSCPNKAGALPFFSEPDCPSDIVSVESEGTLEYGGKLCCYDVVKTERQSFVDCGAGGATSVGEGSMAVSSTGVSTGGGGDPNGNCQRCFPAISTPQGAPICNASQPLFDALTQCMCNGVCSGLCGANVCQGGQADMACVGCLGDPANGCGNELTACANDT